MPAKTERLEMRLRPEEKELIERAAAANGMAVSQFLVPRMLRLARRALRRHERTMLGRRDRELFFEILDGADHPPQALVDAVRRRPRPRS